MHIGYNSKIYTYNPLYSNNTVIILIEQLAPSCGLWELILIRLTSTVNKEHVVIFPVMVSADHELLCKHDLLLIHCCLQCPVMESFSICDLFNTVTDHKLVQNEDKIL